MNFQWSPQYTNYFVEHCMQCRQDGTRCHTRPGSGKTTQGWTCSRCKTKKAMYSFNKSTSSSITVGSEEISEALQKLTGIVNVLVNKVDKLTGEVALLWGCVRDFIDDYKTEDVESPEDILLASDVEEWDASCIKLHNLKGVNSEALRCVMQWCLDKDMAQLRVKGQAEPKKMDANNPYELSNHEFWYGLGGPEKLAEMKLKHDYFQAT